MNLINKSSLFKCKQAAFILEIPYGKNKPMHQQKYTVRVYAFILNQQKQVLIADEYHNNTPMTKLPGGGMEAGEGTLECLKREAVEETGQEIEIIEHLYTTDFYQESGVYKDFQVLAIYYLARFTEAPKFKISDTKHDLKPVNGNISFRLVPANNVLPELFTWPTDKKAAEVFSKKLQGIIASASPPNPAKI